MNDPQGAALSSLSHDTDILSVVGGGPRSCSTPLVFLWLRNRPVERVGAVSGAFVLMAALHEGILQWEAAVGQIYWDAINQVEI